MAVLFSLNLMLQILCIAKMHIYNISTMCIYNISTMCIYNISTMCIYNCWQQAKKRTQIELSAEIKIRIKTQQLKNNTWENS
jgi:hypothetical protein